MLIATPFACTLTTDFDGLSGGLEDAGGDASLSSETGTSTEAGADAGDGYRLAVMADKPSAYWTFDEPAGSMGAADVAGAEHDEDGWPLHEGSLTSGAAPPLG